MTHQEKVAVLIVDDNEADRYLLRRDLMKTGLDVSTFEAKDGQEAMDFLSDFSTNRSKYGDGFPPHVIFVDVNMPRIDGFKFLERFAELRTRIDGLRPCVIMMFSSSEHPTDRERAESHGFVKGYIVKGRSGAAELDQLLRTAL